ncbi:hypothetical protein GUJ93_ZPchr0008g13118 [Zizania palustris]|uniref:Uncharacterized protein n=1 Tax=Zizania palustris TaxID=103762 RepID=A0A8J5R9V6_ZIZPA|nr:hypothetical protein GUJ93_ZPchr0008g13118 [Zizania palustris]
MAPHTFAALPIAHALTDGANVSPPSSWPPPDGIRLHPPAAAFARPALTIVGLYFAPTAAASSRHRRPPLRPNDRRLRPPLRLDGRCLLPATTVATSPR